jgi:tetratricopeptide (TPR) repeat protein
LHSLYTRLSVVQLWDGNAQQALTTIRSALALSKKMSNLDPQNVGSQLDMAEDYANLADALSRSKDEAEALSSIGESTRIVAHLVTVSPKNTEYLGMQAAVDITAGDVSRRFGNYKRALPYYRDGLSIFSQIQSVDPANVDGRLRVAGAANWTGEMLVKQGALNDAVKMFDRALGLTGSEVNSTHHSEEGLYAAADSYAGLAEVEAFAATNHRQQKSIEIDHWRQARLLCERSLEIWNKIKEPGTISPDGFECIPRVAVERLLAQCSRHLRTSSATASKGATDSIKEQ